MVFKIPIKLVVASLTLAVRLAAPAGVCAAELIPTQVEMSARVDDLRSAINAGDVQTAVQTFGEDAVVIQPRIGGLPQIYVGREQIGWWVRSLAAQHAQYGQLAAPRLLGERLHWSDTFSVDAFRQLGLAAVEIESDAVMGDDGLIASLTTVLTPTGARMVQHAPGAAASSNELVPGTVAAELVVAAALLLSFGFVGGAATVFIMSRRGRGLASGGLRVRTN
jgi:hypothetical protein